MKRLAAALLALAACSRSQLLDLGAGDERAPDARPPLPTDCPSALETDAPTPMLGDCSTRAGRSVAALPDGPTAAVQVALPVGTGLGGPKDVVAFAVAASGRAYVTYDPFDQPDDSVLPRALAAVEPDGTIAWSVTIDGYATGTPIVTRDGGALLLHTTAQGLRFFEEREPTAGDVVWSKDVPIAARADPAIDADGALYFTVDDFETPGNVTKTIPHGGPGWTSEPLGSSLSHVALGQDGAVLVASTTGTDTRLFALDPATGATRWELMLDGYGVGGPVVANDGSILVSLGPEQLAKAVLAVVEPTGSIRRLVDLGAQPQPGTATPVVTRDGTAIVRAWDRTFAVDAGGAILWQRMTHPNLVWSATIGADGRMLLMSDEITGVDLATGADLWQLDLPPQPGPTFYFPSAIALGPHGLVLAAGAGVVVFAK